MHRRRVRPDVRRRPRARHVEPSRFPAPFLSAAVRVIREDYADRAAAGEAIIRSRRSSARGLDRHPRQQLRANWPLGPGPLPPGNPGARAPSQDSPTARIKVKPSSRIRQRQRRGSGMSTTDLCGDCSEDVGLLVPTLGVGTRLSDASVHGVKFLPGVLTTVSICEGIMKIGFVLSGNSKPIWTLLIAFQAVTGFPQLASFCAFGSRRQAGILVLPWLSAH